MLDVVAQCIVLVALSKIRGAAHHFARRPNLRCTAACFHENSIGWCCRPSDSWSPEADMHVDAHAELKKRSLRLSAHALSRLRR